ncbi:hypothetical protein ACTWPT_02590 [Nonomuraea sp. 3N208]|uniref:hypothetical protein n=1 Tax=Nonomuraea sp. 3N208 TaxID=3457421 RepID=UPI003FCE9F51
MAPSSSHRFELAVAQMVELLGKNPVHLNSPEPRHQLVSRAPSEPEIVQFFQ